MERGRTRGSRAKRGDEVEDHLSSNRLSLLSQAKFLSFLLVCMLLLVAGLWQAWAQESTPPVDPSEEVSLLQEPSATFTPSPTPTLTLTPIQPLVVTGSEPGQSQSGSQIVLSIFGANFTPQTVVRLVGVGLLETTFANPNAVTAIVPATAPPGTYRIDVSDPLTGTASSPNTLTINAPPASPFPTARPLPTFEPPTAVPGEPSLLIRNYTTNPPAVSPGGTVTFSLEIINQGSRAAEGVSIAIDSGGSFVAASGQANVLLPNVPPGGSIGATLTALASTTVPDGPSNVSVSMSYRDFEGRTYSSRGDLTVTVSRVSELSRLTVARYLVDPSPVQPGQPVTINALITNSGNAPATRVLLQLSGGGVLLPGPQGDSFPLNNILSGETVEVELPFIVSGNAEAGPQPQSFTISYMQDEQPQQYTGSITIPVARVENAEPLFILESYDTGELILHPGDQFTLSMNVVNIGKAAASDVLVTFSGTSIGNDGDGTPAPVQLSQTTLFAPLGTGGELYVGTVEADGGNAALTQDFLVNGSVESGIYSLPINLRYQNPDGTSAQDSLNASIVVVVPPRLRITNTLPEQVDIFEPIDLSVNIVNIGRNDVNLTFASVEADNAEVVEGMETFIGTLPPDSDMEIEASLLTFMEGTTTITVTLHYTDDLNRDQTIVETYEVFVRPIPSPSPTRRSDALNATLMATITSTPPPAPETDTLGRFLRGLLGLGS
jgi:uncharacterized repeat protein (TIGR01451 family)